MAQKDVTHLIDDLDGKEANEAVSFGLGGAAEVDGIDNPVLHFVPENYLSPFESGAADAMLAALGKRCGIHLTRESREHVAAACAYLPYWMRMAGSYIHRQIDLDERPVTIELDMVAPLCMEFAA